MINLQNKILDPKPASKKTKKAEKDSKNLKLKKSENKKGYKMKVTNLYE